MRDWIHVWVFAVGLIGFLLLVSLHSWLGDGLGFAWGFAILPLSALKLAGSARGRRGEQAATDYWRSSGPR